MSIYAKPVSQIIPADLQEMLANGDVENLRLEFKSDVPDKDETLKKLSSFANTYGGTMVVGATAPSANGRVEALPGVEPQPGYKQKVIDWCFLGATPPVTVEVSDSIPVENGKVCYVVRVPESDLAPHFLNGRKGIWVRSDEFSQRVKAQFADESEIRHLLDRRKLIVERRESLLMRARRRLNDNPYFSVSKVRLEVCIVPRFPARPLCEEQRLRGLIENSRTGYLQRHYPNTANGAFSQHESVVVVPASNTFDDNGGGASLFEANMWGMLFYAMGILESGQDGVGIQMGRVVGALSLFVRHAAGMLQLMGYSGPLVLETSLLSIRGREWFDRSVRTMFHPNHHSGTTLDDAVQFEIATSTEALQESPDGVTINILRPLMFAVNWSGQVETNAKLEALVRRGFEFNLWPANEELKL